MALADQLNTVECGVSGLIGSGRLGCPIDPENIKHLFALQAGTRITGEVTRELLRSLQKEGKLIPLLDAFNVTWNNEENQTETSENSGQMLQARKGLYSLTATFANGIYFQKVLSSMEGNQRWDIVLVDDADNMFGTTGRNDEFKGYRSGMFSVNPYTFKQGSTSGKTSVTIQFIRSGEFNNDVAYLASESFSDFLPSDIDGVNQARLDVTGLIDASSSLTIKAVLEKDNNTFVSGLEVADVLVKVNGATATGTLVENTETKTYTYSLTSPAALVADDTVEVKLYDSAQNRSVIEVGVSPDEILYQSREYTAVVTGA